MLMSTKIPLAKRVFCHGFVTGGDGKKMSKSLGNVVNPDDVLKNYDADTVRYFICSQAHYGILLSFFLCFVFFCTVFAHFFAYVFNSALFLFLFLLFFFVFLSFICLELHMTLCISHVLYDLWCGCVC